MFCHIVPTTYLKSWKVANSEHSIYIFNKINLQLKGNLKNILNLKGTNFGKVNFFYLKIETCNSRIYDDLFIPIINELNKNYIIEYKNNEIIEPGLFRINYLCHKDELIVKKKTDNQQIKIKYLENIINNLWNKSQKMFIEEFFSKEIENVWDKFLKIVSNKNEKLINQNFRKYIILFISLQLYRDGSIIDHQLKQILPQLKLINYNENNIQNKILIDVIYEFIHEYSNDSKISNNIIYNTYLNFLDEKWRFQFLFNLNNDFLTSDNPVFIEKINNIELILLPLSPKVCLIITKDKNDTTEIKEISQKEKVLLNKLIIKNSKQNIAYYEEKINLSIYNQT